MNEVRVVDARNVAGAARLLDAFNSEYDEPTPGPEWLAERLRELIGGGDTSVLVAGDDAGVAILRFRGSLWQFGAECHLAELYVVPERRGEGLGRALLEAALAEARERGADHVDLATSEDDVAARHLYEAQGFRRTEGPDGPLCFAYERDL